MALARCSCAADLDLTVEAYVSQAGVCRAVHGRGDRNSKTATERLRVQGGMKIRQVSLAARQVWRCGAAEYRSLCRSRYQPGSNAIVGLEHIDPEDLRIRRWGLVEEGTTFTNYFRAGQVLFGKRRAYQRKIAVADFAGVCSGDIYVFESKDERLLPELLPFICQSEAFFEHAVGTSAGSLSPRTNWDQLSGFEFTLPPLTEQRYIADLLSCSSLCAEDLRVLSMKARELRLSTADDLLSSGGERNTPFGRIPKEWDFRPIGDVTISSSFGPRFSSTLYSERGTVKTIRTTDFETYGRINFDTAPVADLDSRVIASHRLGVGDFLLSRSGEYAGMVRVFWPPSGTEYEYIPAAFLIRFRLDNSQILPQYLFELFESPKGSAIVRSLARGSAQPNISGSAFLRLQVPIPPLNEQRRICGVLESLRNTEQLIDHRRACVASVHKSLSSRLLTGSRDAGI